MAMTTASPTAASAAATAMTKKAMAWPPTFPVCRANARNVRFAAFSMSSTLIMTMSAFRLRRTPESPIVNRIAASHRYQVTGTMALDPLLRDHHGADDGDEQEEARDLEREEELRVEHLPDGLHRAEPIRVGERAHRPVRDARDGGDEDGEERERAADADVL